MISQHHERLKHLDIRIVQERIGNKAGTEQLQVIERLLVVLPAAKILQVQIKGNLLVILPAVRILQAQINKRDMMEQLHVVESLPLPKARVFQMMINKNTKMSWLHGMTILLVIISTNAKILSTMTMMM